MDTSLRSMLEKHVLDGTVPGVVASVGRHPDPVAVGRSSPEGPELRPEAIMRIQSMTKLITAVAALQLVQDGALDLHEPIAPWMPELEQPRVLRTPGSPLSDTVPSPRPITLHHLLTNTSGVGMATGDDSPIAVAMRENGTAAGVDPPVLGAEDWVQALADLPLIVAPGEGWRYHHSFGLLGVLLGRLTELSTRELLREQIFRPVGMPDTGFWVRDGQAHRLPPAFRHTPSGLVETEPAGGGFYASPPPFDVSHAELVSTHADLFAFLRALLGGDLLDPPLLDALRSDQVPPEVKTDDSFFPGFWEGTGWGYGVAVHTSGPRTGRFGWSGGQGTDVFVDPDGTIGLLLTQVELGERMWGLLEEFQEVRAGNGREDVPPALS